MVILRIEYHSWLIIRLLINGKLYLSELLLKKQSCSIIVYILQNVPPQMFGSVINTTLRDSNQEFHSQKKQLGIRNQWGKDWFYHY